jgi:hypothetical protein
MDSKKGSVRGEQKMPSDARACGQILVNSWMLAARAPAHQCVRQIAGKRFRVSVFHEAKIAYDAMGRPQKTWFISDLGSR